MSTTASLQGIHFDDDVAISPIQRALILKTFPGFVHLNGSELAVMAAVCRERFFPAGATMLVPNTPVVAFYLVVEGKVEVIRQGATSQTLGARSAVGGLAALTRDPKGTHAVVVEDTLALEIDIDDMQDVYDDHFNILLGVLVALARTTRELQMQRGGAAQAARQYYEGVDTERPLGLVEKMFFMRRTATFSGTNVEALADLAASTTEKRVKAGHVLWELDERAAGSALVVSGEVKCTPATGEPFAMGVGYVVGGLDSLASKPRWYRAEAATDVTYLEMRLTDLFDVLEDHVDVAMEFMRGLARGLNATLEAEAARAQLRRSQPPSKVSDGEDGGDDEGEAHGSQDP
jgi:CRP-like cAMP-binding protein